MSRLLACLCLVLPAVVLGQAPPRITVLGSGVIDGKSVRKRLEALPAWRAETESEARCTLLETRALEGLQWAGFGAAKVDAESVPETNRIVLRMTLGARSAAGAITVRGNRRISSAEIGAALARAWVPGKPARLGVAAKTWLWSRVVALYDDSGVLGVRGRIELVPDEGGAVRLRVVVDSEGRAYRVGRVAFSAGFPDDPSVVAAYIGLAAGQRYDRDRSREIRRKLLATGRYLGVEVRHSLREDGRADLSIEIDPWKKVRTWGEHPWQELSDLVRARAWLREAFRRGAHAGIEVVSPGLAGLKSAQLAIGTDAARLRIGPWELQLTSEAASLLDHDLRRSATIELRSPVHFYVSVIGKPLAKSERSSGRTFALDWGVGFTTGGDIPFRFTIPDSLLAAIASGIDPRFKTTVSEFAVDDVGFSLRIDRKTGAWKLSGKLHHELANATIRLDTTGLAAAIHADRRRLDDFEKCPLDTCLESPVRAGVRAWSTRYGFVEEDQKLLLAALRFEERDFEGFLAPSAPRVEQTHRERFLLAGEFRDAVTTSSSTSFLDSWAVDSWPRTLAMMLGLLYSGERRAMPEVRRMIQSLARDERMGPIGCWIATRGLSFLGFGTSEFFLRKARRELNFDAFLGDVRALSPQDAPWRGLLRGVERRWKAIGVESLEAGLRQLWDSKLEAWMRRLIDDAGR